MGIPTLTTRGPADRTTGYLQGVHSTVRGVSRRPRVHHLPGRPRPCIRHWSTSPGSWLAEVPDMRLLNQSVRDRGTAEGLPAEAPLGKESGYRSHLRLTRAAHILTQHIHALANWMFTKLVVEHHPQVQVAGWAVRGPSQNSGMLVHSV